MKANHIVVYAPFLIILIGLFLPIKLKPYNIAMPENLSGIEHLDIQSIKLKNQSHIKPKEIFLINKDALRQSNNHIEFEMPKLTIISKDKSGYFCFLDGKLYRVGDEGNNFKVLKIGNDYVSLQTPIGRQTLYVKIP